MIILLIDHQLVMFDDPPNCIENFAYSILMHLNQIHIYFLYYSYLFKNLLYFPKFYVIHIYFNFKIIQKFIFYYLAVSDL